MLASVIFLAVEDRFGHRISYLRISVTDRCNERCRYCLPEELQEWLPRGGILSYEEILRLVRVGAALGIRKVRVTGGEPLTRKGVLGFLRSLRDLPGIEDLGLSTNGTLLATPDPEFATGRSTASLLAEFGISSVNISLDTLDRSSYSEISGRDFLPKVLDGIDAALEAGIPQVKLNCVLMKGHSERSIPQLVEFAKSKGLLLRFIELMPVSSREMLSETNFLSVGAAKKLIESQTGPLIVRSELRGYGPATYYQIPGREQVIGFIGAMTNLHFCDTCNKLRLTADGKLRPCLGSCLEFDILTALRRGASDEDLQGIILNVVDRKPKEHEFRGNYIPNRKMIAIGG